jgi:prepilin-type N-terminal cleavage/methylation domain-containing protein
VRKFFSLPLPPPLSLTYPASQGERKGSQMTVASRTTISPFSRPTQSELARERGGGRGRNAFTLVEVLVTVALVSVALVGVMGGIASLTKADIRAQDAVLLQQLANQKLHEIAQTTDPRTAETTGDFTEQGYPSITWEQTLEPSSTENVDVLSVTTTKNNKTNNGNEQTQTLAELVYVPPVTLGASTIGGSR